MTNRRRVLVTGGLGYVGGRVARALAERPQTRVVLTSRRPDLAPSLPFAIERVAAWDPGQAMPDELLDGLLRGATDVVHLAAANEIMSAADPEGAVEVTVNGTVRLLRRARAAGVRRFLFVSTAHVYGAPLVGHFDEGSPCRPVHPYAITHRAAEDFVLAARLPGSPVPGSRGTDGTLEAGTMETVVVRLSNAFGRPVWPGVDRWTLVVNDLCRQAVEQGRLVLRSSGRQVRDFIGLEDVAQAIVHLLDAPSGALGDGLFNVGHRSATIFEMAQRVQARAEVVLGMRPALHVAGESGGAGTDGAVAKARAEEGQATLHFDCAKLAASGFSWRGDIDAEIDGTLRLCRDAFGTSRLLSPDSSPRISPGHTLGTPLNPTSSAGLRPPLAPPLAEPNDPPAGPPRSPTRRPK